MAFQDKVVDIIECGLNAIDVIISICDRGNIFTDNNSITYIDYADKINVRVDDYIFHSVHRLNEYVADERPYKITNNMVEVEHVQE